VINIVKYTQKIIEKISLREDSNRDSFPLYLEFLIQDKNLPLAIILGLLEKYMLDNRIDLVHHILNHVFSRGDQNPLLAEFEGKFLWASGDRELAEEVITKAYEKWKRPYLLSLLGVFNELK
jgi:hypothetical protein